ncbi:MULTISPECIES: hypothetical protein [unclassified Sphingomonas]|uniref:hypothetical protein n=1 Tax=unclassified Sphingomonas TaxID=196159 RepID=UPI0022699459|nr:MULTISPECIES: hypothetical protein [unclassified Sphingomonas]
MTIRTTKTRLGLATALLTAAALAGCSKAPHDDAPVMENAVNDPGVPEEAAPTPAPELPPEPAVETNASVATPPPEAEIAPDVQVQDDADATGMTAHMPRDEQPANNTEPQ